MSELFKDLVIDSESPSGLRWSDSALREELHGQYARF